MTQLPLFAKATKFRRPRRVVNRYGDVRRVWRLTDGSGLVVESTGIAGVKLPRHYHAIIVVEGRESLISRHRKLRPAQLAVVKATTVNQPKRPTPKKRKKLRG